jgi:flavin reductase (DIM6/NTAB) family NADH-FMN oxidoreductase RutF
MKEYISIANEKAYKLLNTGALVLVCTVSANGQYNIAPIAWHCPVDYDPVTRLLFVTDQSHKTFSNIEETRQFVISVPHFGQVELVKILGSCSGHDTNKIDTLLIETIYAEVINCKVPLDCIGYIECQVYNIVKDKEVALVFGEAVRAKVDKEAFNNRLLSETEAGKPIHHLGGKLFYTASDVIKK